MKKGYNGLINLVKARKSKVVLATLLGGAFMITLGMAIVLIRQALNYPEMSEEATFLSIEAGIFVFMSTCFLVLWSSSLKYLKVKVGE